MILLTGASGYIGSAIYASLKRQSISVVTAGRSDCDRFLDLSQDGISPELFAVSMVPQLRLALGVLASL